MTGTDDLSISRRGFVAAAVGGGVATGSVVGASASGSWGNGREMNAAQASADGQQGVSASVGLMIVAVVIAALSPLGFGILLLGWGQRGRGPEQETETDDHEPESS